MTELTTYTDPNGGWSVQYPADLLQIEHPSETLTVFISKNRHTVAAVDAFLASGNMHGNTGEDLRNQARDTLEKVYGKPVDETDIVQVPQRPWKTGTTFRTDKGSKGEALYMQPGLNRGNLHVYGFIYGHKAVDEAEMRPILEAMRASFALLDAR